MPPSRKTSKPKAQTATQKLRARYQEAGFFATIRAACRHVLRHMLSRLEMKDYGFTTQTTAPAPRATSFAARAQAAQKQGDWQMAGLLWQQELASPARAHVGMSEAAAAQGDMARADMILREALTEWPGNALLLDAYCRRALQAKRWGEVTRRWQMVEESGCLIDPKLKLPVVEAFVQIGDLDHAGTLLADLRPGMADTSPFLRMEALLAEARQDWSKAADLWLARGARTKGPGQIASFERGVRALIRAGDLDRAETQSQTLVRKFPKTINYAKLHAEVAIAQDAWAVALERWQAVEALDPAQAGTMPPAWIFRIGVEAARQRTEAIRIARLRATGMLALAATIQKFDEVGALVLARRARRFYPDQVQAMTSRILATNMRHAAACWWQHQLIKGAKKPQPHYRQLIESLLMSARLEECDAVLGDYETNYGQDNLWLRGKTECLFRQGNHAALQDLLQSAIRSKRKITIKNLQTMVWVRNALRMHPQPWAALPDSLRPLIVQVSALHDTRGMANTIEIMLDPARGDAASADYHKMIEAARKGELELSDSLLEEIAQFFMQRRDWEPLKQLLELADPDGFQPGREKKTWSVVQLQIDLQLGEADLPGAEATAIRFAQQLVEHDLDGFLLSLSATLLSRLPFCVPLIDIMTGAAERIGLPEMTTRLAEWKTRYAHITPPAPLPEGDGAPKRCFVVGNAPSLGQIPLHLLEGEDIFCVNRGMKALELGLPVPKALVIGDRHVLKNHTQEILSDARQLDYFFVSSDCLWRNDLDCPLIPFGSTGLKLSLAPFKAAPLHFHRGETIVVITAQLAAALGYKEIYIIGVDLDYSGPATHFFGAGVKEKQRLGTFRPGGIGSDLVNYAFENLSAVVAEQGCKIYNAGRGGKLDSIPRVTFEDLFEKKETT